MTTDTEALRQKFERHIVATGRSDGELIFEAGHYLYPDVQEIWGLYQAGHAAAKAEDAAAVAKERERCALVCEDVRRAVAEINGVGVAAAQQCADAIRAGAKEPSDG